MGREPAETTTHYAADGVTVTGYSVTVRESEFTARDQAALLQDWDDEHTPRNHWGIPIAEATDAANNPFDPAATGRFVAEPIIDFAEHAVETAVASRKKMLSNPEDDWPLRWSVRRVSATPVGESSDGGQGGESDSEDSGHAEQ